MLKIWNLLLCLLVSLAGSVACDDGGSSGSDGDADTDSDSDSDSDAEGDFPGNCDCAARFTLDGTTVKICEQSSSTCLCRILTGGEYTTCFISSGDGIFKLDSIEMSKFSVGETYTNFKSVDSSVVVAVSDVNYLAELFTVFFDQWDGAGGIASGRFTADVTLRSGDEVEITDGQFYAPIVQE